LPVDLILILVSTLVLNLDLTLGLDESQVKTKDLAKLDLTHYNLFVKRPSIC